MSFGLHVPIAVDVFVASHSHSKDTCLINMNVIIMILDIVIIGKLYGKYTPQSHIDITSE